MAKHCMPTSLRIILTGIVLWVLRVGGACGQEHPISSPSGRLRAEVSVGHRIEYSVQLDGRTIIDRASAALGLPEMGDRPEVLGTTTRRIDRLVEPVVPHKDARIEDRSNELVIELTAQVAFHLRLYDDGVAYRFATSRQDEITVVSETAELRFAGAPTVYFPEEEGFQSHYEQPYQVLKMAALSGSRLGSLPVLVVTEGTYVVITEADLYDYPGMFLAGTGGNALHARFPSYVLETEPQPGKEDRNEVITREADFIAVTTGRRSFPWRVLILSDDVRALVESNLVFQLSRPLALQSTEWIRPGQVAWDWWNALNIHGVDFEAGINTRTYKHYIDFASRHGIEYVILDEGWSGTTELVTQYQPEVDVPELVRYGREREVGVILWVLWKPLDRDMERILDTYAGWGVRGIKVDFMQRADQYMVSYYRRVAHEAALRHLIVDFHGAFKPAGLRRAYPNVLSYEGVMGLEHNKWSDEVTPEHNVTLPFIRMTAGPMDYTPGAMNNAQEKNFRSVFHRPMSMGTRCHQLAMYVVFESPLQMLADSPSGYRREAESVGFISRVPTVWDETRVLDAQLADYIVVARRKGESWYLGAMTDWTPRELEIDLAFLDEGAYRMEAMGDGSNAHRFAGDFKRENRLVDSTSSVKIRLAPGGGWAAILTRRQP